MSSRRLFWILPVAAVLLCAVTMWERAQRRTRRKPSRSIAIGSMRLVGPPMQFELYDSRNRTVRLSRYLGRHRIDLVFLAAGIAMADDPLLAALRSRESAHAEGGILLIVSPELPQTIRRQQAVFGTADLVVVSDAGGRRGQLPGSAARAWGVLGRDGHVASTRWFAIDRAGRVESSAAGPLARDTKTVLSGGSARSGLEK